MALTPSELRRRKMNLLMAMSYAAFASTKASTWSPTLLFAAGEQGAWYDPSDFLPNWRLNLLTWSESFDNAAWSKESNGSTTAGTLVDNSTSGRHVVYQTLSGDYNVSRTFSVEAKQNTLRYLAMTVPSPSDSNCYSAIFDLQTGGTPVTKTNGTGTISASIVPQGDGWYLCSIAGVVATSGSGNYYPMIGTSDRADFTGTLVQNNMPSYSGTGQSLFIRKADLRLTSNASVSPTYQKITDGIQDYLTYQPQPVMFQDSAGTTPVTAVEQPVGLLLDKSKGLALGSELLTNGDFSGGTSGWTAASSTLSTDAGRLKITAASTYAFAYQALTTVIGRTYKLTYSITNGDATACYMYVDTAAGLNAANFDSGAKADGTYSAVFVATATTTYVKPFIAGSGKFAFYDNISARELPGNHASQSTLASRPMFRQEATGQYYLAFDGSDDSLATGSIDFSATDKMSVFAGVRKLSDASGGLIAELGNSSAGGWYLYPGSWVSATGANYTFLSRGTAADAFGQAIQAGTYTAPITNVLAATGNISGDLNTLRVNGVAGTNATADQGTGNYGNLPLNIGRRNNASLPFNGRLYSLIVRGAQSTDAQIASTETWVNRKTGAY